jgi:thiol:disulfide interchange protein DsbD
MKNLKYTGLKHWTGIMLVLGLVAWASAAAIEPDEVRRFEDVFVISADAPDRSRIEVSWDIAPDYFLYKNRFLQFSIETPGVELGEPQIPSGEVSFDDLLGEQVEKFHGKVTVTLPLISVDPDIDGLRLKARSQGCLEGVLCYPPTEQTVLVGLPPAKPALPERDASEVEPQAVPPALSPAGKVDIDAMLNNSGNDQPESLTGSDSMDPALPADSAFIYEAIGFSADTILVRMTAQPGYYLYRDKFAFRVMDDSGFTVREVSLPDGVVKDDPEFGSVPVIYGQVEMPVRVDRPAGPATTISLQAEFQGCRDGDICYPPMSRIVSLEMPASATAFGAGADRGGAEAAPPVSEQDRLARLLTENTGKAIFAFFLAGILLAFTPCVFPMVPILSGIIAGQGERLDSGRAFWLSLVYVLAMAVTYTAAGILAGLFGQNLQAVFQNPWILSAFVLIFVLLALSMFGFYELQLPGTLQTRLAEASNQQKGGSLLGVMVMGFLSALIVGPCVAPPLMAALIVIGTSGDAWLGGSALFALSMGMGVPLILFGVSAGKLLPRAGQWMNAVKAVFGVGLLALAIWLLERLLPGGLIMLLWGVLAIACGVYLRALEPLPEGISPWRRLWKALGLMLLLIGALELVGAAAGGEYWLRPLDSFRSANMGTAENKARFQRIKSLDDLKNAVVQANAESKGVMLDFYADWCVECLRMERNTFHHPEVQALLNQMQPLQADVTANDTVDRELLSAFGIIGPPAILFFDRNGKEMKPWRLVGYFPPDEFAAHLTSVLTAQ